MSKHRSLKLLIRAVFKRILYIESVFKGTQNVRVCKRFGGLPFPFPCICFGKVLCARIALLSRFAL